MYSSTMNNTNNNHNTSIWAPLAFLWVKFGHGRPLEVSTQGCRNVNALIENIKAAMPNDLGSVDSHHLNLYTSALQINALRADIPIHQIAGQPGYPINSYDYPLYVSIGRFKLRINWAGRFCF
jgi:hypothetical protein